MAPLSAGRRHGSILTYYVVTACGYDRNDLKARIGRWTAKEGAMFLNGGFSSICVQKVPGITTGINLHIVLEYKHYTPNLPKTPKYISI